MKDFSLLRKDFDPGQLPEAVTAVSVTRAGPVAVPDALGPIGEFHRRGQRRIDLTVDAANETGATHLYESVGMRAASQYDVYEKRL